jgi:hypothetical protein
MEVITADCAPTPAVEVRADRSARTALGAARAHVRERRQRGDVDRGC